MENNPLRHSYENPRINAKGPCNVQSHFGKVPRWGSISSDFIRLSNKPTRTKPPVRLDSNRSRPMSVSHKLLEPRANSLSGPRKSSTFVDEMAVCNDSSNKTGPAVGPGGQ